MSGGAAERAFSDVFREKLRGSDPRWMINKYVITGESRILPTESHYDLRKEIADWSGVHTNDVVMVGSGKLGFSIDPTQAFKNFHRESDLDMAIVSSELFDYYWRQVFFYMQSDAYWKDRDEFNSYILKGWMRPDLLPSSNFQIRREWWTFFGGLSNRQDYGQYKVRGCVYKNWDFLEEYQTSGLTLCKLKVGRR